MDTLEDPVGAGDALLSYASLALAATGDIVIASILGSVAAARRLRASGQPAGHPGEVDEKIHRIEKRAHFE